MGAQELERELRVMVETAAETAVNAADWVTESEVTDLIDSAQEDYVLESDLPDMDEYVNTSSIYDYVHDALSEHSSGENLSTINDHLSSVARGSDCSDGNPFRAAVVGVVAGLFGVDDEGLMQDSDARIGAMTRKGSQHGKAAHLFGAATRAAAPESLISYGQSMTEGEERWSNGLLAMRSAYRAVTACTTLGISYERDLAEVPATHGIDYPAWAAGYNGPDSLVSDMSVRRPKLAEMVASITPQRGDRPWGRLAQAVAISKLLTPVPCTDTGSPLGTMEARTLSQAGSSLGALYVLPSLPKAQVCWGEVWGRHGEYMLWSRPGLVRLREIETEACKPEDADGTRALFERAEDWHGIMIPGAFAPWGDEPLSNGNYASTGYASEALRMLVYAIGGEAVRSWEANPQPSWTPKPNIQRALSGGMVAL